MRRAATVWGSLLVAGALALGLAGSAAAAQGTLVSSPHPLPVLPKEDGGLP